MDQQFTVNGMTCSNCAQSVEETVLVLDGVTDASVDLDAKRLTVIHDGSVDASAIAQAVERAGYAVAEQ